MTKPSQNFLPHSCPPEKPRRAMEHGSTPHLCSVNHRDWHCIQGLSDWSKAGHDGWFLLPLQCMCLQKQRKKMPPGMSPSSRLLAPQWQHRYVYGTWEGDPQVPNEHFCNFMDSKEALKKLDVQKMGFWNLMKIRPSYPKANPALRITKHQQPTWLSV